MAIEREPCRDFLLKGPEIAHTAPVHREESRAPERLPTCCSSAQSDGHPCVLPPLASITESSPAPHDPKRAGHRMDVLKEDLRCVSALGEGDQETPPGAHPMGGGERWQRRRRRGRTRLQRGAACEYWMPATYLVVPVLGQSPSKIPRKRAPVSEDRNPTSEASDSATAVLTKRGGREGSLLRAPASCCKENDPLPSAAPRSQSTVNPETETLGGTEQTQTHPTGSQPAFPHGSCFYRL